MQTPLMWATWFLHFPFMAWSDFYSQLASSGSLHFHAYKDDPMNDAPHRPPIRVEDLPWEEWSEGAHFGSRYRRLSKAGGGSHVGVSFGSVAKATPCEPVTMSAFRLVSLKATAYSMTAMHLFGFS